MIKVKDIDYNAIYETKTYGSYKIISKAGYDKGRNLLLKIKFITTGFEKIIQYYHLGDNIYDPYFPIIYNIGYLGEPSVPHSVYVKQYHRWSGMLSRCYNKYDINYKTYGAIGVKVDPRWFCFATYYNDIQLLPGYDMVVKNPHIKYYIDKDILQKDIPKNQRIYSPNTCMWVTSYENALQTKMDNKYNNNYHYVYKNHNLYYVQMNLYGELQRIGIFKDEIMAANCANHARAINGLPPVNDVPFIPPEIVNANNLRKRNIAIRRINND